MKAFVLMFNRLTWALPLIEKLAEKCDVILIDNGSTYQPLLDWYKTCPYQLMQMGNDRVSNLKSVLNTFKPDRYILTDHDLDISSVPENWLLQLEKGLNLYPNASKCGLSLELMDLPVNRFTERVFDHECRFWMHRDKYFYHADVATTLALHDAGRHEAGMRNGIRSARPYTARHLPWYMNRDTIMESEEELYYIAHATNYGWSNVAREIFNIKS